jgi:WD40 repeat protein
MEKCMRRIVKWVVGVAVVLIAAVVAFVGFEPPQPGLAAHGPRLEAQFAGYASRSDQPVRALAFSPDGALLAVTGVDGVVRVGPADGSPLPRRFTHEGGATALAFSPDGRIIATAGYDGKVRVWPLPSGTARVVAVSSQPLWTFAFSPDGTTFAAAGEDKLIHLYPAAGGAELRRLAGHTLNVWHLAFAPDGKTLASGSFDRTVRIWEVASGKVLHTSTGHEQGIVGLDVHPGDGLIATGGDDATIRLWEADGAPLRTITAGQYVDAVAFSADGQWLLAGGRESHGINALWKEFAGNRPFGHGVAARIWRVEDGAAVAVLDRQPDDVVAVGFSPDGRLAATGSDDGTVALWRLSPRAGS